jgi:hypothetical protein
VRSFACADFDCHAGLAQVYSPWVRHKQKKAMRVSVGLRENWVFLISLACCIAVYVISYKVALTPYVIALAIIINGVGMIFCFVAIFHSTSFYKLLSYVNFIFLAYGALFLGRKILRLVF